MFIRVCFHTQFPAAKFVPESGRPIGSVYGMVIGGLLGLLIGLVLGYTKEE